MNLNFQTLNDGHTNESTSEVIEWSCEYLQVAFKRHVLIWSPKSSLLLIMRPKSFWLSIDSNSMPSRMCILCGLSFTPIYNTLHLIGLNLSCHFCCPQRPNTRHPREGLKPRIARVGGPDLHYSLFNLHCLHRSEWSDRRANSNGRADLF